MKSRASKSCSDCRAQSEEAWLTAARAFYRDSADIANAFKDYLPDTFRGDLQTLIEAVGTTSESRDIHEEERGGATGALKEKFDELARLGRKSNSIVINFYQDDAEKLAAWAIASHLDAAPQRGDDDDGDDGGTPAI